MALVVPERSREVPLRDVRDLALAVIEGAVASEALANELRRAPERSTHFREIAERLRAVVSRPSIREALIDDRPQVLLQLGDGSTARLSHPAPIAEGRSRPAPSSAPPLEPLASIASAERPSGARRLPDATVSELLEAIARGLQVGEILARLGGLEGELRRALGRESAERIVVRDAADALSLATRLVARLAKGEVLAVEIGQEPSSAVP